MILEPKKNKICHCLHFSPSICHEVKRLDAMILVFQMLSFKPVFSLSSFTFIKRFFSSSFPAIRVVSSAYLRLLIFLPAILIPACEWNVGSSKRTRWTRTLAPHSRLQVKKMSPPRTQNLKLVPCVGLNSNLCYTFYVVGIAMLRSYVRNIPRPLIPEA